MLLTPLLLTPLPLLLMSPNTPRITCSRFLRPFWRLKLPLPLPLPPQLLSSPRRLGRSWRSVPQTYIAESPIWTATTSVSNMRTILLSLKLRGLPKFFLFRLCFGTGSVSAGSSTNRNKTETALSWSDGISSRHSSATTWVTYKPLWTPTGERSKGTLSIS